MIEFIKRTMVIHDFIVERVFPPVLVVIFVGLALFGRPNDFIILAAVSTFIVCMGFASCWALDRYGFAGLFAVVALFHVPIVIAAFAAFA